MVSGCPVCEEPIAAAAARCTACGYPTALALDAMRALNAGEPAPLTTTAPAQPPARRRPVRPPPDPQADLCQKLAVQIETEVQSVQWLGGDAQEPLSDLRQAALAEADGRTREATEVLRRSLETVGDRAGRLFDRRVKDLEDRDAQLTKSGVRTGVTEQLAEVRRSFRAGQRDDSIQHLRSAGVTLSRIEGDWKGLQGLLKQVEQLREAAQTIGREIPGVEEGVALVRELLSGPSLSVEALDRATQAATRTMAQLHEQLPSALEEELARHETALREYPADHEPSRPVRELHSEAVRHLRRGRIPEATASLRQLRAAIQALAALPPKPAPPPPAARRSAPPAPEPPPAAGPEAPAAPPPAELLQRLLGRARTLAARVRSLPADSEVAFEAAAEIRRATEQLRAGKLDEADQTLSRLMRTLDAERPREE